MSGLGSERPALKSSTGRQASCAYVAVSNVVVESHVKSVWLDIGGFQEERVQQTPVNINPKVEGPPYQRVIDDRGARALKNKIGRDFAAWSPVIDQLSDRPRSSA